MYSLEEDIAYWRSCEQKMLKKVAKAERSAVIVRRVGWAGLALGWIFSAAGLTFIVLAFIFERPQTILYGVVVLFSAVTLFLNSHSMRVTTPSSYLESAKSYRKSAEAYQKLYEELGAGRAAEMRMRKLTEKDSETGA